MTPLMIDHAVTDELALFARAFTRGDERAIDNAEAEFDHLIGWLDEIQHSDSPEADAAALGILGANTARQAVIDGWAEA